MQPTKIFARICKPKIKPFHVMHRQFQTKATTLQRFHLHQQRHSASGSAFFSMNKETQQKEGDNIKQQRETIPKQYPEFVASVQKYFPRSMLMSEYFYLANQATVNLGFTGENSMGMAALCRDEITDGAMERVTHYWGKTFDCSSLAALPTFGKTGLGAAAAHAPVDKSDGKRRFVFVAMPHIAISRRGVVGECMREGIEKESHACGALDAIVGELQAGKTVPQLNMEDVEMSLVRMKLLSDLKYGEKPTLEQLTALTLDVITKDVDALLSNNVDLNVYDYVVFTGIQVHGPDDIDWVFPNKCWHASNQYDGNRKELQLPTL